jgi:hypothetical protein
VKGESDWKGLLLFCIITVVNHACIRIAYFFRQQRILSRGGGGSLYDIQQGDDAVMGLLNGIEVHSREFIPFWIQCRLFKV